MGVIDPVREGQREADRRVEIQIRDLVQCAYKKLGISREAYADKLPDRSFLSCTCLLFFLFFFVSTREEEKEWREGERIRRPYLDATFEFRQRQRRPFSSRYPRYSIERIRVI